MSFESLTDDHVATSSELFVDTSIHCCRLKGSLFSDRVRRVLDLFPWVSTSTYVKVEYGNVILSTAEYYLRKIDELGTVEAVLSFIGHALPEAHHKRRRWAFSLLTGLSRTEQERTKRAKLSLQRLLKTGVKYVDAVCDSPLTDGTGCVYSQQNTKNPKTGKLEWKVPNCKRDKKRCRLDELFVEKMEIFRRIKADIDSLPAERLTGQLRDFSELIGRAIDDPGCLLEYRTGCRKLADAIIAVDSDGFGSMFTQNVRESEILCSCLSQSLYYLPPNPDRGIQVQLCTDGQ